MTTRLILDVDTGSDDAVAILAAVGHPELELVGVTCVNGNVTLEHTVDNSLRVLGHVGSDVPVHAGADRPIVRPDFPIPRAALRGDKDESERIHTDVLPFAEATRPASPVSAVRFLIDTIMGDGGDEIVLVATGPLTNVALALAAEPRLARRLRRLVVMGGARGRGNVTAAAEFNFWVDPEAAETVLGAGIGDVLVVPLNATHAAPLDAADCDRLEALGTPAATATSGLVRHRIEHYDHDDPSRPNSPVHDALCVAALVHPEVLTEVVEATAHVETRGERTIGELIVDVRPWRAEPANARVALDADHDVFVRFLEDALRR